MKGLDGARAKGDGCMCITTVAERMEQVCQLSNRAKADGILGRTSDSRIETGLKIHVLPNQDCTRKICSEAR